MSVVCLEHIYILRVNIGYRWTGRLVGGCYLWCVLRMDVIYRILQADEIQSQYLSI